MELKDVLDSASKFARAIEEELNQRKEMAILVIEAEMSDKDVELSFDEKDVEKVKGIAEKVGISFKFDEDSNTIDITEEDETKLDAFFEELDKEGIEYVDESGDSEEEDSTETVTESDLEEAKKWIKTNPAEKGKYEGKTLEDLEKMKADLIKSNDKLQAQGKKVPKENIEKMAELNFAIRAKKGHGFKNEEEAAEDEEFVLEIAKLRKHTSAAEKLKHKKEYRKNRAKIKLKQKRYRKTAKFKRLMKKSKRMARQGRTATGRRQVKRI